MQTAAYYWRMFWRGVLDGRNVLVTHLRWEIVALLAVGIFAAILGASVVQAVVIPLTAIGALCVIVVAGNIILAPARAFQASEAREGALRAQVKRDFQLCQSAQARSRAMLTRSPLRSSKRRLGSNSLTWAGTP